MNNDNKLLFVYGTLLQAGNEFADYLSQHSKVVGPGRFKGNLYDLGSYPGAVYMPNASCYVHGIIVSLTNTTEVLERLDFYEGIGSNDCEYKRELLEIETTDGIKPCWVYIYILDETGLPQISGGDYLKYVREGMKE